MALADKIARIFQNNPEVNPDLNTQIIGNTVPQGYEQTLIDAANQQGEFAPDPYSLQVIEAQKAALAPDAIGPQGQAALYPGLRHNINVGTYSGSIVGANPIFVPGGNIAAIDPVLARRKAIADAAKRQASMLTPFETPQTYKLQDPRFQERFDQVVLGRQNELIDDAKKKYGKDFSIVLQDRNTKEGREFIQEMANFETLGREFDGITQRIAEIDEGLESGELEYSPETLKVYDNYKQLVGSFEKGDLFKSRDLQSQIDKLDGFISLEHYIQQGSFLDDIMGEKMGYTFDADKGQFFRTGTTHVVDYDQAVKQVSESLASGPFRNAIRRGYMTEADIKKTLDSRFKKQKTVTGGIQQKTAATRGAELEQEIFTEGFNTYTSENPNVPKFFQYDTVSGKILRNQDGTPKTWSVNSLADAQASIKGQKRTIFERDEKGKIQSTDTRGIELENVQVLAPDGTIKNIPGRSYSELGEISKLDDGTIVQKARTWAPTRTEVTSENIKKMKALGLDVKEGDTFDSYTPQDHMVVLRTSTGKGTGMITEIKAKGLINNEDAQTKYDQAIEKLDQWKGEVGKTEADDYGL